MGYPFSDRSAELLKIDFNKTIGKNTNWSELGLSKIQEVVFIEQIFNVPVTERNLWREDITLGQLIARYQLAERKVISTLIKAWLLLKNLYDLQVPEAGCLYLHKETPQPEVVGKSKKWQYHQSLPDLESASTILLCDIDPAWNLSAALALSFNTGKQVRVWGENS